MHTGPGERVWACSSPRVEQNAEETGRACCKHCAGSRNGVLFSVARPIGETRPEGQVAGRTRDCQFTPDFVRHHNHAASPSIRFAQNRRSAVHLPAESSEYAFTAGGGAAAGRLRAPCQFICNSRPLIGLRRSPRRARVLQLSNDSTSVRARPPRPAFPCRPAIPLPSSKGIRHADGPWSRAALL
jgi:hypothetical protein